jgi:hypothetical protein
LRDTKDANDADRLKNDPTFQTISSASSATLSLAHIDPLHDVPAIAPDFFSDFEFRRVINDHLQAENRTGRVK